MLTLYITPDGMISKQESDGSELIQLDPLSFGRPFYTMNPVNIQDKPGFSPCMKPGDLYWAEFTRSFWLRNNFYQSHWWIPLTYNEKRNPYDDDFTDDNLILVVKY